MAICPTWKFNPAAVGTRQVVEAGYQAAVVEAGYQAAVVEAGYQAAVMV